MRTINEAGLKLVQRFEGLRLVSYKDSVGVWTIGWGHTRTAKPIMRITEQEALRLLREDLKESEEAVEQLTDGISLTDNQFSALVSFTFNLGAGSLKQSTLLRLLKAGRYTEAAEQFVRWNKAGGAVLAGLTKRRLAERKLFLSEG